MVDNKLYNKHSTRKLRAFHITRSNTCNPQSPASSKPRVRGPNCCESTNHCAYIN